MSGRYKRTSNERNARRSRLLIGGHRNLQLGIPKFCGAGSCLPTLLRSQ